MMSINELSEITKKHPLTLYILMLKQNKDVDYQNIPENGFKTKKEVDEWWESHRNVNTVIKIYDEYYGIDDLIETFKE